MYHHICTNKKILASNLPEKYELLAQSCNVESETFLYEPHDITIHHGKISQEEVEIYLLSEDSGISNEIFKIYQNVYISVLPNIISRLEIDYVRYLMHEMSHLVGGISMICHRYEKKSYETEYQPSKQINDYQRILNNIQKSSFLTKTLISDYYLQYGYGTGRLEYFDVQRLLFSIMNFFKDDLSRLSIKTNIMSSKRQHEIWGSESAVSSIFTKIFQSITDFDDTILPDSELIISTINKTQSIEILIEMTIIKDVAQIFNEEENNCLRFRKSMEIDSMKKLIELVRGKFQFELLGQTTKHKLDRFRYKPDNYESYERCRIIISLPNKVK